MEAAGVPWPSLARHGRAVGGTAGWGHIIQRFAGDDAADLLGVERLALQQGLRISIRRPLCCMGCLRARVGSVTKRFTSCRS